MKQKQFIFALLAMLLSFSISTSAEELLVSCDYNSSTEGYGVSKFSNYAGAYAYATANATSATIVIEKTNTLSGNTFDNNHKNYSKLAVVIKDGASMGNALSKWDMTYPVTVEPGGTLTCARPKSASVSNIHIKNTLTVGAKGATKKAVVDFLSDTYQDCDISIRYNGKVLVYNADFYVQDLDAQGTLTIEDSEVTVDGAFASATFLKTTLTNTTMSVNGTLISGGLSDFAGGTSNQLGNVTLNNSTLTINEGDTKVAAIVTATNSDINVNNLTVSKSKTLNLNEGSSLDVAGTITNSGTVKIDGVTATIEGNEVFVPVAAINGVNYKSLDAAFTDANAGDEVKILTAGTYSLSTSGKNITITGAVDGVVFDNIGAKNMGGANVTFNNVTFDYYPNVNYTGLQHSGNLVYNNCIINGQVFLYGQSETFNKCTFNQNSADAYNVWTYGALDVDFNECTFNSVGKSVLVYTESVSTTNDVAVTKCVFNASAPVEGKAAIEIDTSISAGATITVDGETTATGFGTGNVSGNSLWNNKKGNETAANNDVTVVVNNETVLAPIPDVVKIGETGYRSLAAAVKAATAGQTIEFIADVNENVTLNKNLTIDGAGKTFKGSIYLNKSNGYFTIKNVNFEGDGGNYAITSDASVTKFNVENCTAKNYPYGFLYAKRSMGTAIVKDVTVEGCSYGVHSAYGTDLTLENFTANGTSYAIMVQNYGVRNVTLKNCSLTGCENPLVIWERIQTNKITFNFEGVNEMGKAEFCTNTKGEASAMAVINADAVVGTKVCETLAEAVEVAQEGETVVLRRNVQLDSFVTIDKSITLELGNYNVTRDNGTALYVYGDNINVTINGENGLVTGSQALFVKKGSVKVNGGQFHGTNKNSEAVYVIENGKVEIYGGKFSGNGESNFVLNEYDATREATDITVYGGTFVGFNPADNAAEGVGTNFVADNYVVADNGDGSYSVAVDPAYGKVAKVGETYFATLPEAVEAAEAGATVTMISDAIGAGVVINKNVTIDFGGKTYTVNQAVGSANTATLGLQILKDNNVTLKNGTLTSTAVVDGKEVKMLIQNYANLTLEDMNLIDATDHIQYVLSNNCGNTVLAGATNITTDAVAFDVYDYSSAGYATPSVTINTTGTISGNIEVSASIADDLNITSGTYTVDVTAYCAEGYMVQQSTEGNYAVVVDPAYGKVAKIGDNYFAKLSEAITAATAGQTIEFIADVNENVTINKSLTIDGAGKQYTGTMGANNNLTVTVQNVNFVNGGFAKNNNGDSGTYTIKDCTFYGAGSFYYAVRIKHAKTVNIQNCTVKNYLYSFLYVSHCVLNVNVKNVTVENCPNYAAYFASGVTTATFEGLTVKNSNNGFVINNTDVRNLTIKNCSMENVATAINHSNGTKAINCTALGVNNFGETAVSEYVNFNAEAMAGNVVGDLAGVVNAAKDGETVTLLSDITLTNDDVIKTKDGYNVMVNVDGKNITLDMNGKKILVDNYSKEGYLFAVLYVADGAGLTVTGNGSIDIPQTDRKVAYMFWKRGTTGYLVVENGNFHAGNLEDSMIYTNGDNIVAVNGGTFVIDNIAERDNGCPWIFNAKGSNDNSINIFGGTYNFNVSKQHYADEAKLGANLAMVNNGDGTWTVVPAIAAIDDECYATLAEAIVAAKADDIVTLVADITAEGVVINKDVTIDFAGKTYTVNKAVGSAGTETLGFQILKDNDVTLKNGTLTSTTPVAEGKEVKMLIQNYANLTLEDMNLVDQTDHIQYVLSNNCGDTELTGNTNITTDAVAFDSYKYGSYEAPTVTVNTTGKIEGAIEKNDGATIAISNGTYTTPILPEWCAEYYVPTTNEDGTYGVMYTYVDELTIVDDGKYPEFSNEVDKTIGTLTYQRTFAKVGAWNALYVPFEIPVEVFGDDYMVAYINDMIAHDGNNNGQIETSEMTVEAVVIKNGTLKANHPYVIIPQNEEALDWTLVLNDVILHSTSADKQIAVDFSSAYQKYYVKGTYTVGGKAEFDTTGKGCFALSNSGTWGKFSDTAKLYAFRIYLTMENRDGSPVVVADGAEIRMRIVGEKDEVTGIFTPYTSVTTVKEGIFDLMGRPVVTPEKGKIYIIDGKKTLWK